jgi:hypothetical protein
VNGNLKKNELFHFYSKIASESNFEEEYVWFAKTFSKTIESIYFLIVSI